MLDVERSAIGPLRRRLPRRRQSRRQARGHPLRASSSPWAGRPVRPSSSTALLPAPAVAPSARTTASPRRCLQQPESAGARREHDRSDLGKAHGLPTGRAQIGPKVKSSSPSVGGSDQQHVAMLLDAHGDYAGRKRLMRRLLPTTLILEIAMAAAAIMGLSQPSAASGMARHCRGRPRTGSAGWCGT